MGDKQRVLVVDDEEKLLELVGSYLEASGYLSLCAASGDEGMRLFEQNHVSLILLDLMLPDFSGEEFCRRVRAVSDIPIIMITAKVDEESVVRGLRIGADDYVCKPFSPRELMARVQAALRKSGRPGSERSTEKLLFYDDLILDLENRTLCRGDAAIALTRDEYKILALLMSRQAKVFTRDEILDRIKGDEYDGFDRSVDTHIKNLRAKLGDGPRSPKYILTVYGMGYRFGGRQ
ncbi:MAG: response regulator transcription factor [Treponema sp.]|jgi:DNA-binding response OmpR family regulator|nr:response regulator transcription factor [Treponema sp.]